MTLLLTLAGACLPSFEPRLEQRILEMRDHELDAWDAIDAFTRGDLPAVQDAGRKLARRDPVPGLPEHLAPLLLAVRGEAEALTRADSLVAAAEPLGRMAGHCGGCHAEIGVSPAAVRYDHAAEEAFFAVAFRDEARWQRNALALAAFGIPDLPDGPAVDPWPERRNLLIQALSALGKDHRP